MYSSTLSSTSPIDVGGCSAPPSGRIIPGKDTVPIVKVAGWATGRVWTGDEKLAHTGIRSPLRPPRSESLHRLSDSPPLFPIRYLSI